LWFWALRFETAAERRHAISTLHTCRASGTQIRFGQHRPVTDVTGWNMPCLRHSMRQFDTLVAAYDVFNQPTCGVKKGSLWMKDRVLN
jgi:hypothetical protein